MADAFIYDHVRTPRGRGKADGSLHGITPIQLAAQALAAVRDRNGLDTSLLDDVVLGCVSPLGEQGADIARVAVLVAGYDESVPGQQLNRFCASGLEAVNSAAAQVMSGQSHGVVAGGVESMSRVPMGSDGGAWAVDPAVAYNTYFVPQGVGADLIATLDGYTRETVDGFAAESQRRAAAAWAEGRFARSVVPVKDVLGRVALDRDEHMRPETTVQSLAALKPSFAGARRAGRLRRDRADALSAGRGDQPRAHGRELERDRGRRGRRADRQQALRHQGGPEAARAHTRHSRRSARSPRSC